MADNQIISIVPNITQLAKVKQKLTDYPPYAIGEGLDRVAEFLNEDSFRESIYPPESDEPFEWSSERQRRAYYATDGFGKGIPYRRTHELMYSGSFQVDKKYSSLYITYENTAPYSQYVIGNFTQIIGHVARGWKPVNTFVVNKGPEITSIFQRGVMDAWEKMK